MTPTRASAAFTSLRSCQASFFFDGSRSRYAGWNVGISGMPSYVRKLPRSRLIGDSSRSRHCTANLPSATIMRGRIAASWRFKKGSQDATSSGSGLRLPGGRHLSTLQM